ncbi:MULTISPECIES: phenylpropionate dioxygenase ferredoxin reductase subunit [Photorhabdus]|uniref:Phenylpropionate dioxygenase ferredoxin reductase subunit n=2 Tax=Photorhabdus asymbiotica TaxID=291112 RepID=A0ABX9SJA1_9GAMM|nr:phenylpropionate dioxygenase ferredoxin reductase subunit [Photorhabdus asymbiotica]RKS57197.1 phenylpropionate dioxygenase ferredoxin reductase subunit [Photorhabdus asymbiotica]CAQ84444.1 similar to 3-phenylpropionate dioxygenase ferredoxin--nad(+) reductas component [Photorhabdus asymbiotica]
MRSQTFIIVGAGQAGAMAAATLRQQQFDGDIILIGKEYHAPYERPTLSKEYLTQSETEPKYLFSEEFYLNNRIDLRMGQPVSRIIPSEYCVVMENGDKLRYDKLLLTMGARARRFPLLDQLGKNVYTLRTLDDAQRLRQAVKEGKRVLIVGGGVIGLELAATSCELGASVTVIEQADNVMGRCAPPLLQNYLLNRHQEKGVQFFLDTKIVSAQKRGDELVLKLSTGETVIGDIIIYGIGAEFRDKLAVDAGLATHGGIVIDEHCRTSEPDIFAAGDVCLQREPLTGELQRRETWENANRQATIAAHAMMELEPPQPGAPWFWTDQWGINIQMIGNMQAEKWHIKGDLQSDKAILIGTENEILVGAVAINQGREMRNLRKLLANSMTGSF